MVCFPFERGPMARAATSVPLPLTPTLVRRALQWVVLLLVLWIGFQFARFVGSCLDPARPFVERPPGVGGFLPIAGLMGLRLWVERGALDLVQPSAAVLLGLALLVSALFKKSFCAWVCPVGTLSEYLWLLRERLFRRWPARKIPLWADYLLTAPKYLLLAFFGGFIATMSTEHLAAFVEGGYNRVSDVRMLHFFQNPSALTLGVLGALAVLSFLVKNFWCRYLCPCGALTGLVSLLSPLKVKRLDSACTGCVACTRVCPMALKVHQVGTVRSVECTGCLLCVDACPEDKALVVGPSGGWSRARLAVAALGLVVVVYFGGILVARLTGHWHNAITEQEYRQIVPNAMGEFPEH